MLGDLLADLAANAAEQDWMDAALCAQVDPELWFPAKGQPPTEAKKICRRCDVRADCLEYALTHEGGEWNVFGVWGGTSETGRRRLRSQAA